MCCPKPTANTIKRSELTSTSWPIGAIKTPGFFRKGLVHKVMSFIDSPLAAHGFDDEIEFNTQCSSQWDSLCEYHHRSTIRALLIVVQVISTTSPPV